MNALAPLFHLTTESAWTAAGHEYRPASLGTEGFIHLSTDVQWRLTAARFFRGQRGLVLLEIDRAAIEPALRFERADGDDFPHLYAALPRSAVRSVTPLEVDGLGNVVV